MRKSSESSIYRSFVPTLFPRFETHRDAHNSLYWVMGTFAMLLVLIVTAVPCFAATPPSQWSWSFGRAQHYVPRAASATADGNYYVVGFINPTGATVLEDAWITKLDASGKIVWQKAFDSSAWDSFTTVAATPDGGAIAGGATATTRLSEDNWIGGPWIVRFDRDGRVLWQRVYLDEACSIADIRNAPDGGYIAAGSRRNGLFQQACLMKIDSAGAIVWQKTYYDAQRRGQTAFHRLVPTPDGGYVAGGAAPGEGVWSGGSQAWVVKLDASGEIAWQRYYGASGGARGAFLQDIQMTTDGGYFVVGFTALPPDSDFTQAWMLRLDAMGNPQWQGILGPSGGATIVASAVHPAEDGTFVVVGYGIPVPVSEYTTAGGWDRSWDALVWKVDARGGLVWQRAYGGQFSDLALSIHTADDGYVVAGATGYTGGDGQEAWVIKLDRQGLGTACMNVMTSELPWAEIDIPYNNTSATVGTAQSTAAPGHTLQRDTSIVAIHQCYYGGRATNYQGLWWNSPAESESGWGINFAHQGEVIFATWYTYDLTGDAWWLTMTAYQTADNVFSGTLYETTGPAFNAVPFNPNLVTRTPVGTGTLTFTDANNGFFAYTVKGITQTKAITRQVWDMLPTCVWGAQSNLALATNYQDLWWASPPESQSGWGVNFAHEGDTIFTTWYTYDFDGTPLWLSATTPKTSAGTYTGTLYRTTGPPFNADPFNRSAVRRTPVGTSTISFVNGNAASYAYTVALPGSPVVTQAKAVTRQVFRVPGTTCQ